MPLDLPIAFDLEKLVNITFSLPGTATFTFQRHLNSEKSVKLQQAAGMEPCR
jgi:hypothetical protein